jgi:death-on-curing protein
VNYLSAEQVLFIHARLIEETGGTHGVRDLNMLLSALGRSQLTFDDEDLIPDLFRKAAALLEALIRNHPFVDGNKRTGVVAAGLFLRQNGYRLMVKNEELVSIGMGVAQSNYTLDELASWMEANTKSSD